MEYRQDITPDRRGLFIIAIDQSTSMQQAFAHHSMIVPKSQVASIIASALIDEIVMHSGKQNNICDTCPYCDIAVLGYSNSSAYPLLGDSSYILPITYFEQQSPEVITRTFEYVRDGNHLELVTEKYREWITPYALGTTPMAEMFALVNQIVSDWCSNPANSDSFPPVVFNITDGYDDTNHPEETIAQAEAIKSNCTNHGNALIFNICIDSEPDTVRLTFPNANSIPDDHPAETLAATASLLPERFYPIVAQYNTDTQPPYRAICYNSTALMIIPMLDIIDKI